MFKMYPKKLLIAFLTLYLIGFVRGQSIPTPPLNTTRAYGGIAVFQCQVKFGAFQEMTWDFNDQIIYSFLDGDEEYPLGNTKYFVARAGGDFNLTVHDLNYDDGGTYTCAAFAPTATAFLVVLGTPSLTFYPAKPKEDDLVIITCKAEFGGPKKDSISQKLFPRLQMFLDGVLLENTVRHSSDQQLSMTFNLTAAVSTKGAVVTCEIRTENPTMSQDSSSKVDVLYSVRNISFSPSPDDIGIGSILTCSADGNPQPSFEWTNVENPGQRIKDRRFAITDDMIGNNVWRCTGRNWVGEMFEEDVIAIFNIVAQSSPLGTMLVIIIIIIIIIIVLVLLGTGYKFRRNIHGFIQKKENSVKADCDPMERVPLNESGSEVESPKQTELRDEQKVDQSKKKDHSHQTEYTLKSEDRAKGLKDLIANFKLFLKKQADPICIQQLEQLSANSFHKFKANNEDLTFLDQTDQNGRTLLHYLAEYFPILCKGNKELEHEAYIELIKLFSHGKSNVNIKDNHGCTVLHILADKFTREVPEGCAGVFIEVMKHLISCPGMDKQDNCGQTFLHILAKAYNTDMPKHCQDMLIQIVTISGALIGDKKDAKGDTVLHILANKWNWSCQLSEHVITIMQDVMKLRWIDNCKNIQNEEKCTILQILVNNYSKDMPTHCQKIFSELVEHFKTVENVDVKYKQSGTVLHSLVEKYPKGVSENSTKVFSDVLGHIAPIADKDIQDEQGCTVLHILFANYAQTTSQHCKAIFHKLVEELKSGENVHIKDNQGRTVLHTLAKTIANCPELDPGLLPTFKSLATLKNINLPDCHSITPYSWILHGKDKWEKNPKPEIFSQLEAICKRKGAERTTALEGLAVISKEESMVSLTTDYIA